VNQHHKRVYAQRAPRYSCVDTPEKKCDRSLMRTTYRQLITVRLDRRTEGNAPNEPNHKTPPLLMSQLVQPLDPCRLRCGAQVPCTRMAARPACTENDIPVDNVKRKVFVGGRFKPIQSRLLMVSHASATSCTWHHQSKHRRGRLHCTRVSCRRPYSDMS
jgi:hypothetical protein